MTPTQLHLMLNHLPVFGTIFVTVALAAGLFFRSGALIRFGFAVLVVVALAAISVLLTGEPAEKRVEHLAGVSESAIERHEDVARPATYALVVLGLLAVVGLATSLRRPPSRVVATAMFLLTLGMSGVMAWTAHLGGIIRHPEIRAGAAAAAPTAEGDQRVDRDGGDPN